MPVTAYNTLEINKPLKDFPEMFNQETPLNAFISIKYVLVNGHESRLRQLSGYYLKDRLSDTVPDSKVDEKRRNKLLDTEIERVLIYHDSIAAVINKIGENFYGLWNFYRENGKWVSAGEDMGGETVLESEITFREKAKMHIEKVLMIPPNR